jgi:hypothetical protein
MYSVHARLFPFQILDILFHLLEALLRIRNRLPRYRYKAEALLHRCSYQVIGAQGGVPQGAVLGVQVYRLFARQVRRFSGPL